MNGLRASGAKALVFRPVRHDSSRALSRKCGARPLWGGPPGLPSGIRAIKPKKAGQEARPTGYPQFSSLRMRVPS